MILIALLLACVVAIAVLVSRRRSAPKPPVGTATTGRPAARSADLPSYVEALLVRWTDAGVLTVDQANSIRAFEHSAVGVESPRAEKRTHVHAIAEALGYLGGMLGLVGIVVLLAEFWSDFSDLVRLGVPVGAMIVFVIGGMLVPERQSTAMLRLRTFLWFLATAASGIGAWVFSDVVLDVDVARQHWMAVGIVVSILSGALWAGRARPVQHFTTLAGAAVSLGTIIGEFASVGISGLSLWVAGAVLLGFSIRRTGLRAAVNHVGSAITGVVGAMLVVADWRGPGLVFVVVTGLALIAPAAIRRIQLTSPTPLILGVVGLVALVQGVPMAIAHFAQHAGLATGLVVWSAGLVTAFLVGRSLVRIDLAFWIVAGMMIIGGAAITGAQYVGFSTPFGLVTSVALIAFGARPGRALMSVFGLIGIMVFIPWTIGHFFPGEGRVPLLIIVSGLVLVVVAAVLTRIGGRLRGEVRMRS